MTKLSKTVRRETDAARHEKSRRRPFIILLEAPAIIGVQLKGTRQVYRVHAETVYMHGVQLHEDKIAKRAREIHKNEKVPMRSAKARARRELAAKLKR